MLDLNFFLNQPAIREKSASLSRENEHKSVVGKYFMITFLRRGALRGV